MTIEMGGAQLRKAGAEARQALVERAAAQLGAPLEQLEIQEGVVSVRGAPDRRVGYGELQGGRPFDRTITGSAALKRVEEYHVVGLSARRVDLEGKAFGAPSFVHDLRLPGMLHARVVRSRVDGARVLAVDDSAVSDTRVVRLGNFIGVVAEREEQAIKAATQLKITWDVAADAALLARAVGRPVRVQWSRVDEFAGEPKAAAMLLAVHAGLDDEGRIVAWDYQGWSLPHFNRPREALGLLAGREVRGVPPQPGRFFLGSDRNAPTNYRLPTQRGTGHWIAQPPLRTSPMRSLGAAGHTLAHEAFMDEL